MSNVMHWAPFKAGANITGRRLVAMGASDGEVIQSVGSDAVSIGVANRGNVASGGTVEVALDGVADVEYGATVKRGQRLTTNTTGKAVPAVSSGLHLVHADGAAANTDIAVANIKTTDELVGVVATDGTDPGAVSIPADGQIQCANATTNKELIIMWRRAERSVGIALASGVLGDIGSVLIAPAGP